MALIYCVEDDNGIRELITCALQSGGYTVEGFPNGRDFFHRLQKELPSLVLLDIMLPDLDGNAILKRLKAEEDTAVLPVIMLSAKSTEIDKVTSLENGADDYITKPFGIMELLSRVKAVLRRSGGKTAQKQGQLSCQGLLLDLDRRTASYESTEIVLTLRSSSCWRISCGIGGQRFPVTGCWRRCGAFSTRAKPVLWMPTSRRCGRSWRQRNAGISSERCADTGIRSEDDADGMDSLAAAVCGSGGRSGFAGAASADAGQNAKAAANRSQGAETGKAGTDGDPAGTLP